MTDEQKKKVLEMRKRGHTTAQIAAVVEAPTNTVKTYCYRHKSETDKPTAPDQKPGHCKNCGSVIVQMPKRKTKQFCCVRCREIWWNKNRKRHGTNLRAAQCAYCGGEFEKFERSPQRFCSHSCYINDRFGEVKSSGIKQRAVSK